MTTPIPLETTSAEAIEQRAFNWMSTFGEAQYQTRRMGLGERHVDLDHHVDLNNGENRAIVSYDVVVSRRTWIEEQLASCRAYTAYFKDNLPTSEAAGWELLRHYQEYLRLVRMLQAEAAAVHDAMQHRRLLILVRHGDVSLNDAQQNYNRAVARRDALFKHVVRTATGHQEMMRGRVMLRRMDRRIGRAQWELQVLTECASSERVTALMRLRSGWHLQMPIVPAHSRRPLHDIEKWEGSFFSSWELRDVGLVVNLGHAGEVCPHPRDAECWRVVTDSGIHHVNLVFCACDTSRGVDAELGVMGWMRALRGSTKDNPWYLQDSGTLVLQVPEHLRINKGPPSTIPRGSGAAAVQRAAGGSAGPIGFPPALTAQVTEAIRTLSRPVPDAEIPRPEVVARQRERTAHVARDDRERAAHIARQGEGVRPRSGPRIRCRPVPGADAGTRAQREEDLTESLVTSVATATAMRASGYGWSGVGPARKESALAAAYPERADDHSCVSYSFAELKFPRAARPLIAPDTP
ncbi:hypothetical protein B0H11DRAFT_1937124 [Mycena galericulata]|nr:hypothetical protein B0H11DRAFT_1937124 [Mycena galericulata]